MARLGRDNGTYEDTTTKKILSPYPDDHSAVTDCRKLASSSFAGRLAMLIYYRALAESGTRAIRLAGRCWCYAPRRFSIRRSFAR